MHPATAAFLTVSICGGIAGFVLGLAESRFRSVQPGGRMAVTSAIAVLLFVGTALGYAYAFDHFWRALRPETAGLTLTTPVDLPTFVGSVGVPIATFLVTCVLSRRPRPTTRTPCS